MKRILFVIVALLILAGATLYFFPQTRKDLGLEFEPTIVGIQPLGTVPETEVIAVADAVEQMYGFDVVILAEQALPTMAYTEIRYPRYRADSILHWLSQPTYQKMKPDSVNLILSLTKADISITKYNDETGDIKDPEWMYKDFGIFGLGRINGGICVVSSHRLSKNVSAKTFEKRLTRIACHEVGHVLGLRHCPEKKCLMNDANESIKTIDQSTGELCAKCKAAIR